MGPYMTWRPPAVPPVRGRPRSFDASLAATPGIPAPQTTRSTPHEIALLLSCDKTCTGAVAYRRTPLQGVQLCLPLSLGLGPAPPRGGRPLDQPRPHRREQAPPRIRLDRAPSLHVRAPPRIRLDRISLCTCERRLPVLGTWMWRSWVLRSGWWCRWQRPRRHSRTVGASWLMV
jgi:hypothetical protein